VRSTTAPYTESRLTRSVANERVGFPVVEQKVFNPSCRDVVLFTYSTYLYANGLYLVEHSS
jgi:hypothetical protein